MLFLINVLPDTGYFVVKIYFSFFIDWINCFQLPLTLCGASGNWYSNHSLFPSLPFTFFMAFFNCHKIVNPCLNEWSNHIQYNNMVKVPPPFYRSLRFYFLFLHFWHLKNFLLTPCLIRGIQNLFRKLFIIVFWPWYFYFTPWW